MSGPVWELNCATIAANAATAAFAFDSGGWTVASIVPMPAGSRRLPRTCFRILGPNVNRMSALGSLINHGMGGGPSIGLHIASPSNGDMSEPGPNCRSDHSPLTGTVARIGDRIIKTAKIESMFKINHGVLPRKVLDAVSPLPDKKPRMLEPT